MNSVISLKNCSKLMLLSAVIVTPIAYDIASIRVNDVFLILSAIFFFMYKKMVDKSFFLTISICFVILFISAFIGQFVREDISIPGFIFFYKYAAIFLLVGVCKEFFSEPDFLRKAVKAHFFVFLLLSLWVYIYLFLVSSGKITGNFRPSFPLSKSYIESDAHLYSSTLAIMYTTYLFFIRKALGHSTLLTITVSVVSIGAMFLTGSRGGVLMTAMSLSFLCFLSFSRFVYYKKLAAATLINSVFFVILCFALIYFFKDKVNFDLSKVLALFERAINFNITQDESANLRVEFLQQAIVDMTDGFYIFGVGPLASSKVYFDGIISLLISHGGLSLLFFSVLLVFWFVLRIAINNDISISSKSMLIFLVFVYLFSNLITEYIFVMRNMILAIVGISASYFITHRGRGRDITTEC